VRGVGGDRLGFHGANDADGVGRRAAEHSGMQVTRGSGRFNLQVHQATQADTKGRQAISKHFGVGDERDIVGIGYGKANEVPVAIQKCCAPVVSARAGACGTTKVSSTASAPIDNLRAFGCLSGFGIATKLRLSY